MKLAFTSSLSREVRRLIESEMTLGFTRVRDGQTVNTLELVGHNIRGGYYQITLTKEEVFKAFEWYKSHLNND